MLYAVKWWPMETESTVIQIAVLIFKYLLSYFIHSFNDCIVFMLKVFDVSIMCLRNYQIMVRGVGFDATEADIVTIRVYNITFTFPIYNVAKHTAFLGLFCTTCFSHFQNCSQPHPPWLVGHAHKLDNRNTTQFLLKLDHLIFECFGLLPDLLKYIEVPKSAERIACPFFTVHRSLDLSSI